MVSTTFEPGSRRMLHVSEPLAARVHGDHHAALHAVQLVLVLMLDAGQPGVFHAHVAEHLRRQPALGIEALQLLLKVDAAQVQRFHARGGLAIHLARDPGKILLRLHVLQQAVGVLAGHAGQQRRGGFLVGDFTGHGEDRIDLHGHRQLLPVAVVDDAALRRDLHRALLLAVAPAAPIRDSAAPAEWSAAPR